MNTSCQRCNAADREILKLKQTIERYKSRVITANKKLAATQAKLDEVMIEFCQERMTSKQFNNYELHQKRHK